MPVYDFKSLSPFDFEELVRDLIQIDLGLRLESFKSGRDDGIDLRYAKSGGNDIIVQCKHYSRSTIHSLYSNLRREAAKAFKLNPRRYIVATSINLSPKNKQKILDILSPLCTSPMDIYGADDLNNLLSNNKDIERRHFKLWLTDTTELEQVLHASLVTQSQFRIDKIRDSLPYFVGDSLLTKAQALLDKHHCCIICGIPGIGKTTLAEILIWSYIKQGYELIEISKDVREAFNFTPSKGKRIYFYDDFLGQTSLDNKLNKNEDHSLIRFIDAVRASKHSRFILTTREYILNQAQMTYESLSRADFNIWTYTLDLSSYSQRSKAQILYNHLFFSNTPKQYIHRLTENRNYFRIINHRNFNPRIVERLTKGLGFTKIPHQKYVDEFIKNLDNPERIWKDAFENHISQESRYLLIVQASLPYRTPIEALEKAFYAFMISLKHREDQLDLQTQFKRACKETNGNFLSFSKEAQQTLARYHNPSIRDYALNFLGQNTELLIKLAEASIYFEQGIQLCDVADEVEIDIGLSISGNKIWKAIGDSICRNTVTSVSFVSRNTATCSYATIIQPDINGAPEAQLEHIISSFPFCDHVGVNNTIAQLRDIVTDRMQAGAVNKHRIVRIIKAAYKTRLRFVLFNRFFIESAKDCIMEMMNDLSTFEHLLDLGDLFPEIFDNQERDTVVDAFLDCVETAASNVSRWDFAEDIRFQIETISGIASRFSAVTLEYVAPHLESLEKIAIKKESVVSDKQDLNEDRPSAGFDSSDQSIVELFDSLVS